MAKKSAAGRPTDYKTDYNDQAYKLCLLMNATDAELSDFFEVNVDTIYEWKKKHPQFSDAIKKGKLSADTQVASRLFDRAMGAEYIEQQAFKVKIGPSQEEIKIVTLKKQAPPDTKAQMFWLMNRKSKFWRNNPDNSTNDDPVLPVKVNVDVKDARAKP